MCTSLKRTEKRMVSGLVRGTELYLFIGISSMRWGIPNQTKIGLTCWVWIGRKLEFQNVLHQHCFIRTRVFYSHSWKNIPWNKFGLTNYKISMGWTKRNRLSMGQIIRGKRFRFSYKFGLALHICSF